ncbi:MAG: outer membrane protein transport protein [Myxococcota bacterium]
MNALLMLQVTLQALSTPSHAASLDLIEVGGAYGTPGATNPTAIWWNPAGLAVGGGTQFMVELAPTFGGVTADRANPDYGTLNQDLGAAGYPTEYNYGGVDKLSTFAPVPFLGVSSNLMVPGLGVGLGLAVPTGRGGESDQEFGANRYALRAGQIQALHVMAGASYQLLNKIALGASVSFVDSSYYANTDTTVYPDITAEVEGLVGPQDGYQDGYLEDKGYTTTAVLGGDEGNGDHGALHDTTFTFGAGLYVTPIGKKLGISVSYNHGVRLDHDGDLNLKFQCPPQYVPGDIGSSLARVGAETRGICDTNIKGTSAVGYNLPARINLGVVLSPIERLRLEVMGSYVMWSAFKDYEIHTDVTADAIIEAATAADKPVPSAENAEATAELLTQDRLWARDNQDTFWVGVDGKLKLVGPLSGGARVTYDHHAIPDEALSANNIDMDAVIVGLMTQINPIEKLGIGLSFSHQFLMTRTITNSAYGVTIDETAAKEDRYFYPSANGTYSGGINRLGVTVKGKFGGGSIW